MSSHGESSEAHRPKALPLQPVHDDHTLQNQSHPHDKQVRYILHLRAAALPDGTVPLTDCTEK